MLDNDHDYDNDNELPRDFCTAPLDRSAPAVVADLRLAMRIHCLEKPSKGRPRGMPACYCGTCE
jgi:hypothetical protein